FDLLSSGLTWLAVYTGLMLIVLEIPTLSLVAGNQMKAIFVWDYRFNPWLITTFLCTTTVWCLVSCMASYLQAHFAREGRLPAAFAYRKVLRRISAEPGALISVWLMAAGLNLLAIVVPLCTILGVLLLPMAMFVSGTICAITTARVWGAVAQDEQ
ncbi:MAG: hypothetical protein ACRD3W_01025, partial [Terriglobales bacterium]